VPGDDVDELTQLPKHFESNAIHIRGLIVSGYTEAYSHWNAKCSLGDWLEQNGIPALHGVDTRALTKKLRENGTMLGKIEFEGMPVQLKDPNVENLVAQVSVKQPRVFPSSKKGGPRILAYDCGMKYNIIRYFCRLGVELTVVPFDFELTEERYNEFDGIFVSNGPGNPEMAQATIDQLKRALKFGEDRKSLRAKGLEGRGARTKPIFGICLGNQLLALAAGAKTYKLKYGNRGMNQPCVDLRTTRCYITAQNHGYAVDDESLPPDWNPLFMNANDFSNEGIIHKTEPYFSVQFHPEASGGPMDTPFLFDMFLQAIREARPELTTVSTLMFKTPIVRKCLLVGSGGLSIGQAGEFDYSGSQAIKALKEENIEVVLINPNIATVQTASGFADHVYFVPVTADRVLDVIERSAPTRFSSAWAARRRSTSGANCGTAANCSAWACACWARRLTSSRPRKTASCLRASSRKSTSTAPSRCRQRTRRARWRLPSRLASPCSCAPRTRWAVWARDLLPTRKSSWRSWKRRLPFRRKCSLTRTCGGGRRLSTRWCATATTTA